MKRSTIEYDIIEFDHIPNRDEFDSIKEEVKEVIFFGTKDKLTLQDISEFSFNGMESSMNSNKNGIVYVRNSEFILAYYNEDTNIGIVEKVIFILEPK